MDETYVLNPTVEVVPATAGRFELRSALWSGHLEADPYQVGLLQQFESARSVDSVVQELPFHREASATFLGRCIEDGLLLRQGADGNLRFPDRLRIAPTLANTPNFDPSAPSAFVFLGVPYDANTTGLAGAKFGPAAMRAASEAFRYHLEPNTFLPHGFHDYASGTRLLQDIPLADAGDVFIPPGENADRTYDRITDVMINLLESGAIPLVMGGDHSITYAALRAFPNERLGVIHLDAHTDLGAPLPGGGLHHGTVFASVLDKLEYVERITSIGLRGLIDATEHSDNELVTFVGIDQLREQGIDAVIDQIPDDLSHYLSIDIDVVDPAFAPSTGTPVPNGLHPHELKRLVKTIARRRSVVGCDIVEVAQPHGPADGTGALAVECLMTVADGIVKGLQDKLASGDTALEEGLE